MRLQNTLELNLNRGVHLEVIGSPKMIVSKSISAAFKNPGVSLLLC